MQEREKWSTKNRRDLVKFGVFIVQIPNYETLKEEEILRKKRNNKK